MKTHILRKSIGVLALAAFCFTATDAWARLPKPIQIEATIVFVDQETRTAVVKPAQPTKKPKPFVLDWNKDTQFVKNGEAVAAKDLQPGMSAVIFYKHVSFRNPLLKKVVWEDPPDAK
jgi:hypothetical protein